MEKISFYRIKIFDICVLGVWIIGGLYLECDPIGYIDVMLLCRFYVEDYRLLTDHITVEQYYFQAKQEICNVSVS